MDFRSYFLILRGIRRSGNHMSRGPTVISATNENNSDEMRKGIWNRGPDDSIVYTAPTAFYERKI